MKSDNSVVCEVLDGMKKEGKITGFREVNGDNEFRGYNFVIVKKSGRSVEFQAVGSALRARQHTDEFLGVPVIITQGGIPDIKRGILSLMREF